MIIVEYFDTRSDGVVLNRTYSDAGMMIEREGIMYSEAVDPAELNRVYVETDTPIDRTDESSEDVDDESRNEPTDDMVSEDPLDMIDDTI